ncbi:MAG: DUF2851 family protein [Kiritimatiellae bacterium]|nr:DUF2851 family protein [Kiritimatiellia bacterium]
MIIDTDIDDIFPRACRYRSGATSVPGMVREARYDGVGFSWSERHLQCVWADDSLRPLNLLSTDGEEILVESPGTWNLEAGPDFLDAILILGPERRRITGDVEIHIRPADWTAHGHMDDPRYSRVVAHVSYYPGKLPEFSIPAETIQLSLQKGLQINPGFCFDDIDVSSYPYSVVPGTMPRCGAALEQCSPEFRGELLDSAGEERLRRKTIRISKRIGEYGAEQALYEEVMCALGYKHNRASFRRLSGLVHLDVLKAETDGDADCACSLLLGVAGLLPATTSNSWTKETREFVRQLWDKWWKQRSRWEARCLTRDAWRLAGLRPQNHPIRRLAAAAAIFSDAEPLSLRLKAIQTENATEWFKQTQAVLAWPGPTGYWQNYLSFSGKPGKSATALIGARRVAAIASNVIIPFLAAEGTDVTHLLDKLPSEQNNSIIRRMAHALLGRDHNPALYKSGLRQQGLLQIFADFCLNNRSACKDCTLPGVIGG